MSAGGCRQAWNNAQPHQRAPAIDAAFPDCKCEAHSLCAVGGDGVGDNELLARILTSPTDYDETTSTILTQRLMHLYSLGMSVIRQGANDDEIIGTIDELTNADEPRKLVGAVIIPTSMIRAFADPKRWFAAYATDDREKIHHVDLCGTTPDGSNSQVKKISSARRYALRDAMSAHVILAGDAPALLACLRAAGI